MNVTRLLRHTQAARVSRGVSLIEALVALAVMSIGLLGVMGMQATLRTTADVSRQRAEAVRLAQEKVEDLRAFGVLVAPVGSTDHDYTKIVSTVVGTPEVIAPPFCAGSTTVLCANTEFRRSVTVTTPTASQPRFKTVRVRVGWYDRVSDTALDERSVELYTTVAEVAPELGATLGVPANVSGPQRPGGRHITIPRAAVDRRDGTSTFTPPGGSVVWTFSNSSGRLVDPLGTTSLLLTGYIRFATDGRPTGAEAENPIDLARSVGVQVLPTRPTTTPVSCFTSTPGPSDTFVVYYCAVPIVAAVGVPGTYTWDGRSELTSLPLARSPTDDDDDRFRVCRYTPEPDTDTPLAGNVAHPLNYVSVGTSLANQNFLVISAGDGSVPFPCPTEADGADPLLDADTKLHQPR